MKKTTVVILIFIVFIGAVSSMKNLILKRIIIAGATRALGTRVAIKDISWLVSDQKLHISHVKIYNPKGYPDQPLINMATLNIDYRFGTLIAGNPHLKLLEMNVKEIVVVKNKEKNLNINDLNFAKDLGKEGGLIPIFPIRIDLLRLNIDQVVYQDLTKEDKSVTKVYDIGLKNKEFRNIKSARKLVAVTLIHALQRTSLKGVKFYALAAFAGPAFFPVSISSVIVSKDHADTMFNKSFEEAYQKVLSTLKDIGSIKKDNIEKGLIEAQVSGHRVFVRIENAEDSKVKITASARKFKLPRPKVAGGIMYQIALGFDEE